MNGGRLSLVTSSPLSRPASVASATPMSSASGPGIAPSMASVAMTIIDSTQIAPTDRSMPAVRMMSVCPTASAAMIAVCWSSSPIEFAVRKRGFSVVKTSTLMMRMTSGLIQGYWCSVFWIRWIGSGADYRTGRRRPWMSRSTSASVTPAERCALLGGDRLDALGLLVGDQGHAGVVEVQALGDLGLLAPARDLGRWPARSCRSGPGRRPPACRRRSSVRRCSCRRPPGRPSAS